MEEFEAALAELHRLEEARRALSACGEDGLLSHPLNVALREALLADWKAANPKKKVPKNIGKALTAAPNYATIRAEHQARANQWVEENISAPRRAVEDRLEEGARGLEIPRSEEWLEIDDMWASTYRSQGYGAAKYAQARAQEIADKARYYGLEVSIEKVERFKGDLGAGCSFRVSARTTPLGKEILARKPAVPLRDWLAACRQRGVSPRVYLPFLPYGIEEELGVA